MDDYSVKTIRLLIERDKQYLASILCRYSDSLPDPAELTEADAIRIFTSVNHKTKDGSDREEIESSIYTCTCGSKRIATMERQIRSADEGSSIECMCRVCGKTWIA
jgi:DNA-directed RNA polymerase subunit M/transcription elongation factor TFIIS